MVRTRRASWNVWVSRCNQDALRCLPLRFVALDEAFRVRGLSIAFQFLPLAGPSRRCAPTVCCFGGYRRHRDRPGPGGPAALRAGARAGTP